MSLFQAAHTDDSFEALQSQLVVGHLSSAEHVKAVTSVCMPAQGEICNLNSQGATLQILIQGSNIDPMNPAALLTYSCQLHDAL